jgi:hypothetical protein
MAFGQTRHYTLDTWGVAPGYDDEGLLPREPHRKSPVGESLRSVMLEGCSHLPYEEPGVSQLREAVRRFLERVAKKE